MEVYNSHDAYIQDLIKRSALPEGFKTAVAPLTFSPKEMDTPEALPMTLSLILLEEETDAFAGVFTRNALPGYPVIIGKERLKEGFIRGVLINNKVANVLCPGGREAAGRLCRKLGALTGSREEAFFPSSTGVIGWELPVEDMEKTLPQLLDSLQSESLVPLAKGIMTTDNYPKVRSRLVGQGQVSGVAKGAGMIEPNMATMLGFIMTDLDFSRQELQQALNQAVSGSFNNISVDSDQSTSDMVLIFSSRQKKGDLKEFQTALNQVCRELSEDIVRNGEGTSHVIEVRVSGAPAVSFAREAAKQVINSPLVKTAIFGNDPNVGRILAALGDFAGTAGVLLEPEGITIQIGKETVFSKGAFSLDAQKEERLSQYLESCQFSQDSLGYPEHNRKVELHIDLAIGQHQSMVLGSDLSHQYIHENADYRS